jgi:hypothetical protein
VTNDAKGPGLQNPVASQIFLALIRQDAKNQSSPKAITGNFIGISVMVRIFVMQAMTVHPRDRFYIDAEDVVNDSNGFYKPIFIVKITMRDSQMKHISQVHTGCEPTEDEIGSAD